MHIVLNVTNYVHVYIKKKKLVFWSQGKTYIEVELLARKTLLNFEPCKHTVQGSRLC